MEGKTLRVLDAVSLWNEPGTFSPAAGVARTDFSSIISKWRVVSRLAGAGQILTG
jgi:hypothetical protein